MRVLRSFVVITFILVGVSTAAQPELKKKVVPNKFDDFSQLEAWSRDVWGGGGCTKFTTRWKGKEIELCYTTRTFTSGVVTMEITFWRPNGKAWVRTVGTGIVTTELRVDPTPGGVVLSAYDKAAKSWVQWMTIATPLLCVQHNLPY